MTALSTIWPPFGLTLTTPRLELRPIRDEEIPSAVEAAASGIHDPGHSPFSNPWTEVPADELGANMARWYWQCRAGTSPESWMLLFGVWHEGQFLGCQDVEAKDFATLKSVSAGSWLRRSAQGLGFGKEMRAAMLVYSFDYLKADLARSEALDWNAPSLGVSRSLGYESNGTSLQAWAGTRRVVHQIQVTPEAFKRPDWTLQVKGHDPLAHFLRL